MRLLRRPEPAGSAAQAVSEAKPTVAGIFHAHGPAFRATHRLSARQLRLMRDIERCRTAALGGHMYVCDQCVYEVPVYNSCKNRGCPTCQAVDQARWIEARSERLLPVGHHHVVFTLPSQLRPLVLSAPRLMLDLLLDVVRLTLTGLAAERLGVRLGVTAVLHTWTREMLFHPHVHCVVTAGGLSLDGARWLPLTGFLLPVALVKAVFRAHLLAGLDRLLDQGKVRLVAGDDGQLEATARRRLFASLPKPAKWVVYIEKPFGRSTHVLQYLGRYTHRIAISDHRLISVTTEEVTFRTRAGQTCTLSPEQFLARFLLHVLPTGLNKIRHFGLYAPASVKGALATARTLLGAGDATDEPAAAPSPETATEVLARLHGVDLLKCPVCPGGRLHARPLPRLHAHARGPP